MVVQRAIPTDHPFDMIRKVMKKDVNAVKGQSGDGKTVRKYFVNDPEECNHVLRDKEGVWVKGPTTADAFDSIVPGHMYISEGARSSKLRGTAQKCLNDQIPRCTAIAQRHSKNFEEKLVKPAALQAADVTEFDKWTRALAVDIISEVVFGEAWGAVDDFDKGINIKAGALSVVMGDLHWRLADPKYVAWRGNRRVNIEKELSVLEEFVAGAVASRREVKTGDLLSAWMAHNPNLTDEELSAMGLTFLTMGHENVATAMAWVTIMLAENKQVQEEVREEALTTGAPTLVKSPKLEAAFHETVRLYPSVPIVTRMPTEPATICGTKIASGEEVLISFYGQHRNPLWGRGPDEFRVGRVADGCPLRTNPSGFPHAAPFGIGPRRCPGQPLSNVEVHSLVTTLVSKYRLKNRTPSGTKPINFVSLRPGKHCLVFQPLHPDRPVLGKL